MIFLSVIRIFITAFFIFIVVVSFLANFFSSKTIQNVNTLLSLKMVPSSDKQTVEKYNEFQNSNAILFRNLFNVTGKIPKEDLEISSDDLTAKNFYKVPCAPSSETLPVTLVGIIYTANPKTSLVTVQDPDVIGADVYHEGDPLLDYNDYSVYRIVNSNTVEFRYGTKKICRLLGPSKEEVSKVFGKETNEKQDSDDMSGAIVLTQDYVNSQLGEGLSKIVNTARIVPVMENGAVEGFKVFSIEKNTLFEKIGFQNGDIVTKVNNQTLTDPSKGFIIYDSFQYEHQITFTIKRGNEMITRKVIIK